MSNLSIQEQTAKTFNDNILYFEKYQPALFQKISSFQVALEKDYYQAKYDLEFVNDEYFDVKELSTQKYLYGSNSTQYANSLANSIDYKKENNVFIVSPKREYSKEALEALTNSSIKDNNAYAIADIIAYINKSVAPQNSIMKKLEKFIFFGVGLGLQLQTIDKKINSDFYLILEDDLELFFLSLFVTDYKELSKEAKLFFIVFEEDAQTKFIMQSFLEAGFMHNHYIKFLQTLHCHDKKLTTMQEVIASQSHIIFPFHAYFNKFLRPLHYIKEHYQFLNISTKKPFFDENPILIAAAGPSLEKNLPWLKKNQNKFIIIALTSSLKTLEKEHIIPDIVVHLDPFKEGSVPHLEKLKNKSFLQDVIALCAEQSPQEILNFFKKENLYIYQNGSNLKIGYGRGFATCVGSMSYALSLLLQAKEIYFLGLDLALDSESASTHASSHPSAIVLDTTKVDELQSIFNFKDSVIKVKGNFQDEVLTTANFYISINSISNSKKQSTQKTYNLSDGAFLKGVEPLKISSLNIQEFQDLNKTQVHKQLKERFSQYSSNEATEQEKENIHKMLLHSKAIKKLLKQHKSKKFTNIDDYKYSLYDLALNITANPKPEASTLNFVLLHYVQLIFPYIFDMLNTPDIPNMPTHTKKVDQMLSKKLFEIVSYFEEEYEKFFEEEDIKS